MGAAPNWDIDLEYGEAGEARVASILNLDGSRIEVKTDRIFSETQRVFIETQQLPRGGTVYQPSGITTTQADFWAWNVGALVIVPTDAVRRCVAERMNQGEKLKDGGLNGDNPTRGYPMLLGWLTLMSARWFA